MAIDGLAQMVLVPKALAEQKFHFRNWPFATFRDDASIQVRSEADIERFSVCAEAVAFDPEKTWRPFRLSLHLGDQRTWCGRPRRFWTPKNAHVDRPMITRNAGHLPEHEQSLRLDAGSLDDWPPLFDFRHLERCKGCR